MVWLFRAPGCALTGPHHRCVQGFQRQATLNGQLSHLLLAVNVGATQLCFVDLRG